MVVLPPGSMGGSVALIPASELTLDAWGLLSASVALVIWRDSGRASVIRAYLLMFGQRPAQQGSRDIFGLGVHITAPTVQAGYQGRLEMFNAGPYKIKLTERMNICQVIFERLTMPATAVIEAITTLAKCAGGLEREARARARCTR